MHQPIAAILLATTNLAAQAGPAPDAAPKISPPDANAELPPLTAPNEEQSSTVRQPATAQATLPTTIPAKPATLPQPEHFIETRTIRPSEGVTFIDMPEKGSEQVINIPSPNLDTQTPPLANTPDEFLVDAEVPEPLSTQAKQLPPPPPQPTTPMWQPDEASTKPVPAASPAKPASPIATPTRPRVARTPTPEYVLQGIQLYLIGDFETALPILRDNAESGDPRSRHLYGLALFNGQGTTPDRPAGIAWTRLAAMNGIGAASQSLKAMQAASNPSELAASEAAYAFITRPRPISVVNSTPRTATPIRIASSSLKSAQPEPVQPRKVTPEPREAPLKTSPPKPSPLAKPTAISRTGNWTLQLGAFATPANAANLRARLARRPEISGYRLTVTTGARLTSVRASGYSASAAHAACASLQADGFVCVPTGG